MAPPYHVFTCQMSNLSRCCVSMHVFVFVLCIVWFLCLTAKLLSHANPKMKMPWIKCKRKNEAVWNCSIWFVCVNCIFDEKKVPGTIQGVTMFIPTIPWFPLLLLHSWGFCWLYPFFFPHRQTWLKSKPQLCRNAQQNPNQWRLCKEFHYWTLGWPHASAMSAVILGVLPLRWRNPHWFLIRTCQVSIKEVPSPPLVSIEIRLTNKNSLAALFAQSGLLLLLCV